MRSVIFANGVANSLIDALSIIRSDDLIIAVDGGTGHCIALGIIPTVVIGDLDSIYPDDLKKMENQKAKIIRYPAKKDQTDLELAIRYAIDNGYNEILVFGALGARWDMTLANVLFMAAPDFDGANIRLIDGSQEITLLKSGYKLEFHGEIGDILSLIPLKNTYGVTLSGLEYPMKDGELQFGSTRGISNVLIEKTACVYIKKQGLLICVFTRAESLIL